MRHCCSNISFQIINLPSSIYVPFCLIRRQLLISKVYFQEGVLLHCINLDFHNYLIKREWKVKHLGNQMTKYPISDILTLKIK